LDNYRELAADELVGISLWNTVVMALSVPLAIVVGLLMAVALDSGVRGLATYRTIYYLPAIVPMVAASILWIWVFNAQDGLLNGLIARSGLEGAVASVLSAFDVDVPINWLQSARMAKPSLILMALWGAGSGMLIWLAGLKSVPVHLYEAAAIDGAGPIRRFLHVTLPMLSPYIFFNLVMGTIGVFQVFTQAYIMTRGGPNDATLFYAYNLFNQAFRFLRMGYAAALAWVLFGIIMVLTLINIAASRRWVHYESA
jgi:multiple sugar transport system permease protein